MQQLIKSDITVMGRNIWIEPFDSDQDVQFIKLKVEEIIKQLVREQMESKKKLRENKA